MRSMRLACSGVTRKPMVTLLSRAELGQGMSVLPSRPVQRAGHVGLDAGEQVGVAVGDVGRLVAHAVRDGERGEAHVDEQRNVAVPEVVDADGLEAGRFASALHLVAEEVLGHGEDPLVGVEVEEGEERLQLLSAEAGHGDDALRLRGLRVG